MHNNNNDDDTCAWHREAPGTATSTNAEDVLDSQILQEGETGSLERGEQKHAGQST
jgi:hypothetical protein